MTKRKPRIAKLASVFADHPHSSVSDPPRCIAVTRATCGGSGVHVIMGKPTTAEGLRQRTAYVAKSILPDNPTETRVARALFLAAHAGDTFSAEFPPEREYMARQTFYLRLARAAIEAMEP